MIGDKADAADRPDIYTGIEISGRYQIDSLQEVDCNEVTEEGKFPQFGDFVKCRRVDGDGNVEDDICYIARYVDVDRQLADVVDEEGDQFVVERVRERQDGGYAVDVKDSLPE